MSPSTVLGPEHPPILIIAAGRSGTKLLRGILASHPAVAAFPREINYIWRHGNARWPTDELTPAHARPEVIRTIRGRFEAFGHRHRAERVVEKTCANSLRIEFVRACLPEAHIVFLLRDGRAVAESARRRWTADLDPGYLLEKARWLPLSDAPYYAYRYLCYRWDRRSHQDKAVSSWGPRFSGLDQLVREKPLIEVCGLQWQACVEAASASLQDVPPSQVTTVHYEDLVRDPVTVTARLFEHVQLTFEPTCKAYVEQIITQQHLDKWRSALSHEDQNRLTACIGATLDKHGYAV